MEEYTLCWFTNGDFCQTLIDGLYPQEMAISARLQIDGLYPREMATSARLLIVGFYPQELLSFTIS